MYQNDSFFTLTTAGQVGLALLSLGLAMLCLLAVWMIKRKAVALIAALLIFYAFVWLSPQVYYQYYRIIIDDLPAQWVVKAMPSLGHVWSLVTFQTDATLSAQSQGLLGWGLVLFAFVGRKPVGRDK